MARKTGKSQADGTIKETGAVKKSWHGRKRIALVYPNSYAVGMSNLGFQAVYRLLNQDADLLCERAFLPDKNVNPNDGELRTLESRRAIAEFDIIAISISFEADYLNLVTVIQYTGLPLRSAARGDPHPLVIAGGVACFLNPEPIAPFIDCFLIGEAEALLPRFFAADNPDLGRSDRLMQLACNVPGLYAPHFYTPEYLPDGTLKTIGVAPGIPKKIKRVRADITDTPTCSALLTADTAFDNTFLIEVSRGCPHGCRFCSAGFIYRPPRFRPLALLKENLVEGMSRLESAEFPDKRKIGLVGAAVSDHPDLGVLCRSAVEMGASVSFSSLRADAMTPELVAILKSSGVKTATIAPDAGSARMRNVINKNISENDILLATERLVAGGVPNLKIYFMVGLPTEMEADITAIIELVKQIKQVFLEASRPLRHIGSITVSINPFVPKPFTPFQWAAMDSPGIIKKKIAAIRGGLKKTPNVTVQAESAREAYAQAFLARGDRTAADLLESSLLESTTLKQTVKQHRKKADFYAIRARSTDECLPWDFIDHGVKRAFLLAEYKRALAGKPSAPCPITDCARCGVCHPK